MKNKNKTVWSNRFSKGNSRSFQRIGSSINIDKRLYKEDIFASIIHAQMLAKQKIIPKKDGIKIINGLKKIEKEIDSTEDIISAAAGIKFIINLNTKNPEFIEWKWVLPDELPDLIVDFKKNMYVKLLSNIKKFID